MRLDGCMSNNTPGYIVFSTVYSTSWTIMFGKLFYKLTRNTQNHIALVYDCQLAVCGHISIPRNTALCYIFAVDHDQTQLHQEWTAEFDSLIPVTKVTWSRCGENMWIGPAYEAAHSPWLSSVNPKAEGYRYSGWQHTHQRSATSHHMPLEPDVIFGDAPSVLLFSSLGGLPSEHPLRLWDCRVRHGQWS